MTLSNNILVIIPCNSERANEDELYHLDAFPLQIPAVDRGGKKVMKYTGWSMFDLAAHLSYNVTAVIGDTPTIGNQVLEKQLARYCEPFFFPSDINIVKTSETSITGQVAAAISNCSDSIQDVMIIWPHQFIQMSQDAIVTVQVTNAITVPLAAKKLMKECKDTQLCVAFEPHSTLIQGVYTHQQIQDSEGMLLANGILVAAKCDMQTLKLSLIDGETVETVIAREIKGKKAAPIDQNYQTY